MGLLINEKVSFENGVEVNSGSYLTFSTLFPENEYRAIVNIKCYFNQASAENGLTPIMIKDFSHTIIIDFTKEEFLTLELSTIYNKVFEHLSAKFNSENIIAVY